MTVSSEQIVDALLVMDCQAGRVEALEALALRWHGRLWAHARRLTGDADAASDVAQQTWVAVIQGLDRLRDPACFGTWAYRIATHRAADWIRRRRRGRRVPLVDRPAPIAPEVDDAAVRDVVGRLDLKRRTVVSLYYFEHLSLGEISRVLGIPAGTVKSRLHYAKREIRRLLGPEHDPEPKQGVSHEP